MNVLIVGANGFLGNALVKQCQMRHWTTYGAYNKHRERIPTHCRTLQIQKLWSSKIKFTYIFISAAAIPYPDRPVTAKELASTNIELPLLLTKKFPDAKFIFSSSVSVYGTHKEKMTETSAFNNPNLYGLSKICGECIVRTQNKFAIIRFSSLIGKGMHQGTFLPKIISDAKLANSITLLGEGVRKQDYLHVSDAARLCILAARHPHNDIFLGVSGSSYSNVTVAKMIKQYLPDTKIVFKDKDESSSHEYNNSYTTQKLHFTPHVSFQDAIREMI